MIKGCINRQKYGIIDDMETKTVSELAELFGVTRQAMNKRVITMQKGVVVDDTASDHYGKDTSVEQDDDLFDDFLDDGGDDDYAD